MCVWLWMWMSEGTQVPQHACRSGINFPGSVTSFHHGIPGSNTASFYLLSHLSPKAFLKLFLEFILEFHMLDLEINLLEFSAS